MTDVLVSSLLLIGSLLMLLASIGVLRMPDLYLRIGASTKASTLGLVCILAAVAVNFAEIGMATRAIATMVFVLLTAPVAAHMIGRAAYIVGVPLWDRTVVDELDAHRRRPSPASLQGPEKPRDAGTERPVGDGRHVHVG